MDKYAEHFSQIVAEFDTINVKKAFGWIVISMDVSITLKDASPHC